MIGHTRALLLALIGVSAGLVPLEAARNTDGPVHLVVEVEGRLELKREGWTRFSEAAVGTELGEFDLLRLPPGSRAFVACSDLQLTEVTEPIGTAPCQTPSPVLFSTRTKSRVNEPRGYEGDFPVLIRPRRTSLTSKYPVIRWNQVAHVESYTVYVHGLPSGSWSATVKDATELVYPTDAPPLEPGRTYSVEVKTSRSSSSEEGRPGLGFKILPAERTRAIEEGFAGIDRLELEGPAKLFLKITYSAASDLIADAIDSAEQLVEVAPSPRAYLILADLRMISGLERLAEGDYLKALSAAADTDRLEEMAIANRQLGLVYQSLGNPGEARRRLAESLELYRSLGDADQIEAISGLIAALDKATSAQSGAAVSRPLEVSAKHISRLANEALGVSLDERPTEVHSLFVVDGEEDKGPAEQVDPTDPRSRSIDEALQLLVAGKPDEALPILAQIRADDERRRSIGDLAEVMALEAAALLSKEGAPAATRRLHELVEMLRADSGVVKWPEQLSNALLNLARLEAALGRHSQAVQLVREAIAAQQRSSDRRGLGRSLLTMGEIRAMEAMSVVRAHNKRVSEELEARAAEGWRSRVKFEGEPDDFPVQSVAPETAADAHLGMLPLHFTSELPGMFGGLGRFEEEEGEEDPLAGQPASGFNLAASLFEQAREAFRDIEDQGGEANALHKLAEVQILRNQNEAAADSLQEAVRLAGGSGAAPEALAASELLATVAEMLNRFPLAVESYRGAIALAEELESPEKEDKLRTSLSVLYGKLGHPDLATEIKPPAEVEPVEIPLDDSVREAMAQAIEENKIAFETARVTGNTARAEELREKIERQEQYLEDGNTSALLGGDFQDNLNATLRESTTMDVILANILSEELGWEDFAYLMRGKAYARVGDLSAALADLEKALELAKQLVDQVGPTSRFVEAKLELARLALAMGDLDEAKSQAAESLTLTREMGDVSGEADALQIAALADSAEGRYSEALEGLLSSRDLRLSNLERRKAGRSLKDIGDVYFEMGNLPQALAYYRKSLAISEDLKEYIERADVLRRIAGAHLRQGELEAATERLDEARKLLKHIEEASETEVLFELGLVQEALGQDERALDTQNDVLTLARARGDQILEARASEKLAGLRLALGETDAAERLYSSALDTSRELGLRVLESSVLSSLAGLQAARGDYEAALDASLGAVEIEDSLRGRQSLEELRIAASGRAARAYQVGVAALLALGREREALVLSERARAQAFREQLGTAPLRSSTPTDQRLLEREQAVRRELSILEEALAIRRAQPQADRSVRDLALLEERLRTKRTEHLEELDRLRLHTPRSYRLVAGQELDLDQVTALLGAEELTLVSYYFLARSAVAFVIDGQGLRTVELNGASREAVEALAASLLPWRDLDPSVRPPELEQLYDLLIEPVAHLIAERRVGIVPAGVMHRLPFAAFASAEGYFGDDRDLLYLPSISVLDSLVARRRKKDGSALLLAHSAPEGYPVLTHANAEVERVAEKLGAEPYVGANGSEARLKAQAPQSFIVHVAAHGQLFPQRPMYSRLVLAGSAEESEDGLFEVNEVYGLDLSRTDLVVLSACRTQLGSRSQGDDFIGLSRAFFYAGAASLVTSLWSVNDEATSYLMQSFYEHMKTQPKSRALALAQQETRARYPHPYYWSSFVLTGDPGAPPARLGAHGLGRPASAP